MIGLSVVIIIILSELKSDTIVIVIIIVLRNCLNIINHTLLLFIFI